MNTCVEYRGLITEAKKLVSRETIMRTRLYFALTVALFLLSLPIAVTASPPSVSENVQTCLGCHGNKDFYIELQKNEKLPLFIDKDAFAKVCSRRPGLFCVPCRVFCGQTSGAGLEKQEGIYGHRFLALQDLPHEV